MKCFLILLIVVFCKQSHAQEKYYENGDTILSVKGKDTVRILKPVKNGHFLGSLKPHFKGDMGRFIKENLVYPEDAKANKIIGVVRLYCKFDTLGRIDSPIITNYVYPSIDAEAIRLVKLMPAWEPARWNDEGKPVAGWFSVEIPFKL